MAAASSPAASQSESTLTLSTLHHLLANDRRRYAIVALAERARDGDDGWMTLSDLAAVVATGDDVSSRTAYMSLYHQHLSTLADAHVIESKQEDDRLMVRAGPTLGDVLNAHHAVLLSRGEYE